MTDSIRTPDTAFEDLTDFPWLPNYHHWNDVRIHFIDEGPKDAPVVLLLHGMPTWSYLYRHMIPSLIAAGFRCIAPDHAGFGRSDKPTDLEWYSVSRHTEILTSLITSLNLWNITLVCQDWGGPIGLAQAATMPDRFSRLVIMNTWLHNDAFAYSDGIRNWNKHWHEGGLFARPRPNVAALLLLAAGHIDQRAMIDAIVNDSAPDPGTPAASVYNAYDAPFRGLDDGAYNGLRKFPLSIPLDDFDSGNGAAQQLHRRVLRDTSLPVNFIWGGKDDIFTEAWGREWSREFANSTFDLIAEAGHFLQESHGETIARTLLDRIAEDDAGSPGDSPA